MLGLVVEAYVSSCAVTEFEDSFFICSLAFTSGCARSPMTSTALLSDCLTLRDFARRTGLSYWVAYSRAAAGEFGEPVTIGRSHFYRRDRVEAAIRARRGAPRRAPARSSLVGAA